MKKYLLLFFFAVGGLSNALAQSPIIYDTNGNNITNSSVTLSFNNTETYLKMVFLLKNPGENDVVVSMRKIEVDVLEGTDNTFCFAGKCYAPQVFVAPDKMTINPGETTNQSECYSEYYPNGKTGSSTIKYEFFSEDNSFETVYVNAVFVSAEPTSISNLPFANVVVSDPYPNPARGHTTIDYAFTPEVTSARIVVRSLTGQIITSMPLSLEANKVRIDTSSLNSGMYFYSIELNDRIFVSKRLIVSK